MPRIEKRGEEEGGTTSDDGRTRTSPRSITLNGTVVAVDGRHNDDGRSSREAPSHPTTKLRFTSDKGRPLTNAFLKSSQRSIEQQGEAEIRGRMDWSQGHRVPLSHPCPLTPTTATGDTPEVVGFGLDGKAAFTLFKMRGEGTPSPTLYDLAA